MTNLKVLSGLLAAGVQLERYNLTSGLALLHYAKCKHTVITIVLYWYITSHHVFFVDLISKHLEILQLFHAIFL